MHGHCHDFTRAGVLRRAAAEAGRGLPAIEPGQPIPAGTGLTRRSVMLRSAGLALSVYGGAKLAGVAPLEEAIAAAAAGGPSDPVIVSVFLEGGIDSLSLLAPVEDSTYRRARPRLALPADAGRPFGEDPRLRWHPLAAPLATLHGEGKLTVMPAVGYSSPDQSHFNSRHFWEVGAVSTRAATGWMGRYLDRVGSQENPVQGLALDGQLAPSLATATVPVAAVAGPDDYRFWGRHVWGEVEGWMHDAIGSVARASAGGDPTLAAVAKVGVRSARLREQLAGFVGSGDGPAFTSPVAYPPESAGKLPRRLAGIAAMLAAGLPLRCVAVSADGNFDTHDNQRAGFERGLKLTADSLLAFQRDLEARGLDRRVVTLVWSEFGRRAEENGSQGTDHGAAGIGFLMGSRVHGRMVGEFPGVRRLDSHGNLRATSDFRAVYSSLLEQWLSTDAAAVIPGASRFARPKLIN